MVSLCLQGWDRNLTAMLSLFTNRSLEPLRIRLVTLALLVDTYMVLVGSLVSNER